MGKYGDIYSKVSSSVFQKHFKLNPSLIPLIRLYIKLFGYPDLANNMRYRETIKLIGPNKSDLLLDVGSGNGIYSNQIAYYFGIKVVGLEGRPERVRNSIQISKDLNTKAEFKITDLEKPIFEKNKFHKIICFEVMEHIKNDKQLFLKMSKALKPGGRLYVTVPKSMYNHAKEYKTYDKFEHVRDGYSTSDLKSLTRNSDLKAVKIEPYFFLFTKYLVKIQQILYKHSHPIFNISIYPFLLLFSYLDSLIKINNTSRGIVAVFEKKIS
jgi:SAM-dependent methyltransferase